MSVERASPTVHASDAKGLAGLSFALNVARARLRWLSIWPALLIGLVCGALCAAAWVGFVRFTLVDLPAWPAAVIYLLCIFASCAWTLGKPLTASRAARFLDTQLGLDERVGTLLELRRSRRGPGQSSAAPQAQRRILSEASQLVLERLDNLPGRTHWTPSRTQVVAVFFPIVILALSVVAASPFDAVRAERAAIQTALTARISDLEALRLEIASDSLVPQEAKRKLDAELWALQQLLRTPGMSRSELVATLAAAEQRVRELSESPVSAFGGLLEAAELVWNQAVNTQYWAADVVVSDSELSRAADAADYLSDFAPLFNVDEDRVIALTFDRAAQLTGQTHPGLTTDFKEAAEALRTEEGVVAGREIAQVAERFRNAEGEYQAAQAFEKTLAKLDESRHDVAQAGAVVHKRGQVGFRRRGTSQQAKVTPTGTTREAGAIPPANTPKPAQGIAAGAEPNAASEGQATREPSTSGTPSSQGSSGMPGAPQPPGTDQSSTGRPRDPASVGREGGEGPSESAPGGGGEGEDAGTMQGPLTGPVGGSSGAISRVPNPQGSGTTGSGQTPSGGEQSGDGNTVSIPQSADPSMVAGSESPGDEAGTRGGGEGGQAVGESGGEQSRSGGIMTSVKTPYKEVVREYAERATEALDRTYIPSDAKEYVKQYFTELGK